MAKVETTRVVMNMPLGLLGELDEYAKKMNVNRTSAVCFLLSKALDEQKVMSDLGEFLKIYQESQEGSRKVKKTQ